MSKPTFFTGEGDAGDTSRLGGKERIAKSDALIEAIGTIDEATCAIGMARAMVQHVQVREVLLEAQRHLYRLMSHLSATSDVRTLYTGVSNVEVQWLESIIKNLETNLPSLKGFILPGDSVAGAACHQARASIRRAERHLVALTAIEAGILAPNLAYVNRLSSLMFVAALIEDHFAGTESTLAKD